MHEWTTRVTPADACVGSLADAGSVLAESREHQREEGCGEATQRGEQRKGDECRRSGNISALQWQPVGCGEMM